MLVHKVMLCSGGFHPGRSGVVGISSCLTAVCHSVTSLAVVATRLEETFYPSKDTAIPVCHFVKLCMDASLPVV